MKLLIIDGNSIINRAFYAIRELTAPSGLHTGGIYGFLTTYFKTVREEKPDYIAVAFDLPAPTFRHKAFDGYKATRHKMPEELAEQMPVLKEILSAMRVPILEAEGFEADDIIGTVSKICEDENVDCRILTGDRDDLQLVSEKTGVLLTTTRMGRTETVLYGIAEVREKYGVEPAGLIEMKGLMGDSSDNIPGVAGIGEKTAGDLIVKYGTIENIYAHIEELRGAQRKKIEEGREMAFLSRMLGTIRRDVPIGKTLSELAVCEADGAALSALFAGLNFKKFAEELALPAESAAEDVDAAAKPYGGEPITAPEIYVYQTEEGFFVTDGKAVYKGTAGDFASVFADPSVIKSGHGIKYCIKALYKEGGTFAPIGQDAAIAAYLLSPAENRYDAPALCEKYLGKTPVSAAAVCHLLPQLCAALGGALSEREQLSLYETMEKPLIPVLARMEVRGIAAEKSQLAALSASLSEKISGLETAVWAKAGEVFNIQSPRQLGVVLFEKLGLPAAKKTKTGYSTDAAILEKLRTKHPIIEDILEYRQLTKLRSTYAEGLGAYIDDDSGRISSLFHQTVTATGRISSSDPNLQNIPVRTEAGREIRKVFVAPAGRVLVDADYSQIELRVLAHMADDKKMQASFSEGADIHTRTAAEIFGVAEFMVTPELRARAKTINFGIIYGMGEFTLAGDLHISRKEAAGYIAGYFNNFSGVRAFMDAQKDFARENGYVKTLFGRRRYIPELSASSFNVRAFGERVAMNAPIQGTAADIIKLAMIRTEAALEKEAPTAKLILQVHDELIVEADEGDAETVASIVKREMENACTLSVPLSAEVGIGKSWYEAKK